MPCQVVLIMCVYYLPKYIKGLDQLLGVRSTRKLVEIHNRFALSICDFLHNYLTKKSITCCTFYLRVQWPLHVWSIGSWPTRFWRKNVGCPSFFNLLMRLHWVFCTIINARCTNRQMTDVWSGCIRMSYLKIR